MGGPPDREDGPVSDRATLNIFDTTSHHQEAGSVHSTARQCTSALHRRHRAADRCEPLTTGHRDPWTPWRPEHLSDKQIEAAAVAARHLLDQGVAPRFDDATLRAMSRAGHQDLVERLHEVAS